MSLESLSCISHAEKEEERGIQSMTHSSLKSSLLFITCAFPFHSSRSCRLLIHPLHLFVSRNPIHSSVHEMAECHPLSLTCSSTGFPTTSTTTLSYHFSINEVACNTHCLQRHEPVILKTSSSIKAIKKSDDQTSLYSFA